VNIKLRNLGIRFAFCGALVISSLYMVWPDPITATRLRPLSMPPVAPTLPVSVPPPPSSNRFGSST